MIEVIKPIKLTKIPVINEINNEYKRFYPKNYLNE